MLFWPSIKGLFTLGRPATVVWGVGTIVVDSIQGHFRRRIAHVSVEIFENEPTITDSDASSSIVFVIGEIWIETSRFHCFPRAISTGVWLSLLGISAFAVLESVFGFALQTSARLIGAAQIVTKNDAFVSTIAATKPARISVWTLGARKDDQAVESLTSKVFESWHPAILAGQKLMVKLI